jgi:hypothetical protein
VILIPRNMTNLKALENVVLFKLYQYKAVFMVDIKSIYIKFGSTF